MLQIFSDEPYYWLTDEQEGQIEVVAVDMWPAFANSIETNVPQAEIVHDRFHISKHLNDGVDKVRRQENKALMQEDDERLKGTKHSWLFNPENMSEDRWIDFEALPDSGKGQELKTSRAWAIKEQFRWFWALSMCFGNTQATPTSFSISGTTGQHVVSSSRSSKSPKCLKNTL